MPDKVTIDPLSAQPSGAAEKNAEIAAKQAAQDLAGHSGAGNPKDYQAAGDALDALAKEHEAKVNPVVPEPTPEELAAKKAEEEAAAKAAEAEAAKNAEAAKVREEQLKKADEYFKDSPTLPTNASPKSSEAFSSIKARAVEEISKREAEIEELKKAKADLEAKIKEPSPELAQRDKELSDLRAWRAKLDVDFDPKFKSFDQTVAQGNEFIYAQLKKSPVVTDAVIEEIKKYGGPANCNLAKVFEAIKDPVAQRIIEAKIADVTMAQYQKEQAIKAAKENISTYMEHRQKEVEGAADAHRTQTEKEVGTMLQHLEWYKEQKAGEKATAEEAKAVQEHNDFLKNLNGQLKSALTDDSPQMRAILVTGLAQLFNLQRTHTAQTARVQQLEKELAEVTAKWDKVKAASVSRSRNSNASTNPSASTSQPKPVSVSTPAGQALDDLMKGVMEKRAAAANA